MLIRKLLEGKNKVCFSNYDIAEIYRSACHPSSDLGKTEECWIPVHSNQASLNILLAL